MGKVIMSGIVPQLEAPITGILASTLAVGSTVYLMENGSPVEYLVVNQGIPSGSSLYDASCDGTWLLRKDLCVDYVEFDSNYRAYATSDLRTYLNETFFNVFDSKTQSAIKQVKIPVNDKTTISSGSSGLLAKVFPLSGYEVGFTTAINSRIPIDGAVVSYFNGASETDSKRIAYCDGEVWEWWTRSQHTSNTSFAWAVDMSGGSANASITNPYCARPALILPSTAIFDEATLVFKGVK